MARALLLAKQIRPDIQSGLFISQLRYHAARYNRTVKKAIPLAVVLVATLWTYGQQCPDTNPLAEENYSDHWLQGHIASKQVRMWIATGGNGVIGTLYFTSDWEPLMLVGERDKAGSLMLFAEEGDTNHRKKIARLVGTLKSQVFSGRWTPLVEKTPESVRLETIAKPHCETDSGKWNLFDDPRWPITFQYPASWHLESDSTNLILTCPDPKFMAYEGFNIAVSFGVHHSDEDFWLKQCGKGWYSSTCDCGDLNGVFCSTPAEATKREGMTFLNADAQEWRSYCRGGGYVGLTDGYRRVVLIGDKYVEFVGEGPPSQLIEEILPTVKPR